MNEQPAGIRANMKDSLSSLSKKATKSPVERARIYLLLSMLHAVVQERLRYAPNLGWKGFWSSMTVMYVYPLCYIAAAANFNTV